MCVAVKRALVLAVALCASLCAGPPMWHNLYPSYTGLAFGEGKFAAVSADGVIKVTSDLAPEWSQHFVSVGAKRELYAAAYGNGKFVVTQNHNSMLTSGGDAASWGTSYTSSNIAYRYITFGKEMFVGISQAGKTFVHGVFPDYENPDGPGVWGWEEYNYTAADTLFHAASDGNVFVAVGRNIVSSSNAQGWSVRRAVSGGLGCVAYDGEGKFVAANRGGNQVSISADGTNWQEEAASGLPPNLKNMVYGGGKFVAVGAAGAAAWSADGTSWSSATLNAADNFIAVRYGEGKGFMALGERGSVYTSQNGETWTKYADGRTMNYRQIVRSDGGKFVAVGDSGTIAWSSDGKNWNTAEIANGTTRNLLGVVAGGGKFAAVGDSGTIFMSDNGEQWTNASLANTQTMFSGVAYGSNMFLAVGQSTTGGTMIWRLADGTSEWSQVTVSTTYWPSQAYPTSITFGNGRFFAGVGGIGAGGQIKYCIPNEQGQANIWNSAANSGEINSSYNIVSITQADGRFVALGQASAGANAIYMSSNGLAGNWIEISPAPASRIKQVVYAKNYYIAVGDSGKVLATNNSAQGWVLQPQATNKNLNTIYAADNAIIVGGASGALLYSDVTPTMVSVRHTARAHGTRTAGRMSMELTGKTPVVKLSFTPATPGRIEVFSLSGKRLYRANVAAGERSINLPERAALSGSVIVRFTSGDGAVTAQRFQVVR